MKNISILYIDDDGDLTTVVSHYLKNEGYDVHIAHSGKDVALILPQLKPEVIIFDLELPDADGFNVLSYIRSASDAGIIIASGKSDTTEKIIGLEMGADDYLTKPFELREMAARIKAILRRRATPPPATSIHTPITATEPAAVASSRPVRLTFEGLCLDRNQYQVFDSQGASLDLTTGEFKLLEALVLSPNRVLSRDQPILRMFVRVCRPWAKTR